MLSFRLFSKAACSLQEIEKYLWLTITLDTDTFRIITLSISIELCFLIYANINHNSTMQINAQEIPLKMITHCRWFLIAAPS